MKATGPVTALLVGAAIMAAAPPGDHAGPTLPDRPPSAHLFGVLASGAAVGDTVEDRAAARARTAARAGRHGEAARHFVEAAGARPSVAHWLLLSALQHAARAGDTAVAAAARRGLEGNGVVPEDSVRTAWARAAFEAGDVDGGLSRSRGLSGDADPELWARWVGPSLLAAADTARAREGLAAAAASPDAPPEAAARLMELDPGWESLARAGTADLSAGREARGRRILRRALEDAPASDGAEYALRLATAELDAGRPGPAHQVTASWLARPGLPAELRARMEIVAARSHLRRGETGAWEVHLRRGSEAGGGEASARAAYLLAHRAHERGNTELARARYRRAADGHPGTEHGGLARMRLGLLALHQGRRDDAAAQFRRYRSEVPDGSWYQAALYWEGRARLGAGDRAGAEALFRRAHRRSPFGYYGLKAAERLELDPWRVLEGEGRPDRDGNRPPGEDEGAGHGPGLDSEGAEDGRSDPGPESLLARMELLRGLEWEARALRELEAARPEAVAAAGGPLALARRLNEAGWTAPGIGLAWQAFREHAGRWTEELLRAVYPLPHREAVVEAARRHGLPPALVAAVARQESRFSPLAVSPAGAEGLMQLMPATAARMAADEGLADELDLFRPEPNLALGTRYLAGLVRRFETLPLALAAYNAGPRRVTAWRRFPEFRAGGETAIERIPFRETRRYVKAVIRNVELYRRLYDL